MTTLSRICGHYALLPRSLQITLPNFLSGEPQYRGGYADVWKGEYNSRDVAVKVLRVYSTSDLGKNMTVGIFCLVRAHIKQLMSTHVDVLQRGRDVESSPPSECAATLGSGNGQSSISDGIGVDGKWKHHQFHRGASGCEPV